MIKNSVLYYGMPQCGKSTLLLKTFIKDHKAHQRDLCINMWTFLHPNPRLAPKTTLGYIRSAHGSFVALQLPYNPKLWLPIISEYHQHFPKIRRVMIDEAQCINPVYLVTLIMIIRDFYSNVPVIFTSIDYDSWHHKLPQIKDLIALTPKHFHLNHKCMFCHRMAQRRLHVVNGKPCYNAKKYDEILEHHKYTKSGRPTMFSVCIHHYQNPPQDLKQAAQRNWAYYHRPVAKNKRQA